MLNYDSVKNFCFDVLGDFVDPSNIEIEETRFHKFNVIVLRNGGIPKEVLWDEWKKQTAGTEFEGKVTLFV
jgi:hypothetical protein